MKTKKTWMFMLSFCLIFMFSGVLMPGSADAAAKIQWSDVQQGRYSSLSPFTLNWTGDVLDRGGYNLSQMNVTSDSSKTDFVITQSGYIAASGIIKVNEGLEDATDASISQFKSYENVTQGAVYLIVLHDGSWAKVKIDTVSKSYMDYLSSVTFSYVVKTGLVQDQPTYDSPEVDYKPGQFAEDVASGLYDENPFADPAYDLRFPGAEYTFEEGPIDIIFPAEPDQIAFDVYRSDNGGPYVPVSDFLLEEPEYTEYYAFAGHTYLYIFVAYDQYGVSEVDLPIKITIVPKATDQTTAKLIKMKLESTKALVDGKEVTLEVPPVVVNGRMLVPLRFISEAVGAEVGWDGATRTISIALGDKEISLTLDSSEAMVNGKKVMMDVPATTLRGSTMVPVRFVGESLDLVLDFNSDTRELTIQGGTSSNDAAPDDGYGTGHTPASQTPLEQLVGIWDMWIPSENPQVPGASGGILIIYDDFTWENYYNEKVTVGEIDVDEEGRVVLLNYMFQWDWYAYPTSDGIKISSPPAAYQVGTLFSFFE